MKKETPVKIIKGKGRKHKTELRVFRRDIYESFCVQPGCRFNGKRSQQGICHTTKTFTGDPSWSYIDAVEKNAETLLKDTRKQFRGKGLRSYVRNLESLFVTNWMSAVFHCDEMVRLRRRVALYKPAGYGGTGRCRRCAQHFGPVTTQSHRKVGRDTRTSR